MRPKTPFPQQEPGTAESRLIELARELRVGEPVPERGFGGLGVRDKITIACIELQRLTREVAAWRAAFPMHGPDLETGHIVRVDWSTS